MPKKLRQESRFGFYAVLKYKRKYILIEKSKGPYKGKWDLPGGKIDFGETPLEALERELMEETGLKAKSIKLLDAVSYKRTGENEISHHVAVIYECETGSIKKLKRTPDGHDSYGADVFTKKELKKLKLTPLAKMMLK